MWLGLESGQANLAGMQALLGCLLLADAGPTAEYHIPVTTAKVLDTPLPVLSLCCAKLLQLCLLVTPWTVAHQAPLSMGFSRQEYWSGLPDPPLPGDLPDPGIEPMSLMSTFIGRRVLYHWCHLGSLGLGLLSL